VEQPEPVPPPEPEPQPVAPPRLEKVIPPKLVEKPMPERVAPPLREMSEWCRGLEPVVEAVALDVLDWVPGELGRVAVPGWPVCHRAQG